MKKFLVFFAVLASMAVTAKAEVVVYYGQGWTPLPNCGGYTQLTCDGPRQNNQCHIEFSNSYGCPLINLYTKADYYPKYETVVNKDMQGSFWVDNSKVNDWFAAKPNFRVFMHNADNSTYEKIRYIFAY